LLDEHLVEGDAFGGPVTTSGSAWAEVAPPPSWLAFPKNCWGMNPSSG